MSEFKPEVGTIGWVDLTVDDAPGLRDFYAAVVGWETSAVPMGDYDDYCLGPPDAGVPTVGVCHKRGANAPIPSQWMIYIVVADLEASLKAVAAGGGEIVMPTREMGEARYALIRDPAGAVCALYQS